MLFTLLLLALAGDNSIARTQCINKYVMDGISTTRNGGTYHAFSIASSDPTTIERECKAACCDAGAACKAVVYSESAASGIGSCRQSSACCELKSIIPKRSVCDNCLATRSRAGLRTTAALPVHHNQYTLSDPGAAGAATAGAATADAAEKNLWSVSSTTSEVADLVERQLQNSHLAGGFRDQGIDGPGELLLFRAYCTHADYYC
jgi:hypothetical protein